MNFRLGLILCCFLYSVNTRAQTFSVTGRVVDAKDTSGMIGVSVLLTKTADTSAKTGGVTDVDGNFSIPSVQPGAYTLRFDYLGYTSMTRAITVGSSDVSLGIIKMSTGSKQLKGVTISGTQIRAEQSGDTSSFNSSGYKTNPDATAEDLVNKMPGVTSDGSSVKVNGEAVQQVYIDGKPFFGTDPTLALKNLPAEVIDKIQVFDKLSDQSTFTGFDDGNAQKTLNIITKRNKSEGIFGKVYAGYGTDNRYIAGGNLNIFEGDRRMSIIGLSNNINQQNFSSQDILGITGGSGQGQGGQGASSRGGGRGGPGGGGGSANNFLVGQQGGITTTHSVGFNYSDSWGKKLKVSGSYFFNATDNTTGTTLTRDYFTSSDTTNIYHETSSTEAQNTNHRVNMRFEYTIDSYNSIIFTPGISFQNNQTTSSTLATDSIGNSLASLSDIRSSAKNNGYSTANNLLFQHKFAKPRRTISFNLNASLNEKSGDGSYKSHNQFFDVVSSQDTTIDQHYTLYNNTSKYVGNVTYTEPIGKKGQLMANYNPSLSWRASNKETYDFSSLTSDYTTRDTALSNQITSTYNTQRGGLSYRIGDRKLNFNVGTNIQYATLEGDQQFPHVFNIDRNFTNILPNSFFNYRFSDGRNLRVMYRTNTTEPSITQLQNVLDITNPLLLKTGNENLKQTYEQTFIVRYGQTKGKNNHSFFVNLYSNYVDDYIANQNIIPTKDTMFLDPVSGVGIPIPKGSQLSRPVNLSGYWNTRSFFTYGFPITGIKCNLNLNGGFNYNRNPGMINDVINYSNYYTPLFGIVLSSNISEQFDFTLSYSGNYNIVKNTTRTQSNSNYYSHVAALRFNWMITKALVFNTNITNNYYTAFTSTGNQDYLLWNAYVGYKLLKDRVLEARLSVFDILNQNRSISRTVTDLYIENSVTQVLKQYFMLQLTYTLRSFKGVGAAQAPPADGRMPPPNPDGTRPEWRGERPPFDH